jgi:SAM-dependent methyltransferase
VQHCVMNAECLAYADHSFDLVFGSGILHHLDLGAALDEVSRVLKPDGQAAFFEPLGHNSLINLYRRFTPAMRTADEHPLRMDDLARLPDRFAHVNVRYFHLLSLLAMVFRRTPVFGPLLSFLHALDRIVLAVPFLRKQAWVVVICVAQPRQ